MNRRMVFSALTLVTLTQPLSAAGQGVIVSGIAAATSIESTTETSGAAAVGFRVNRIASLGVEFTSVPALKPDAAAVGLFESDGVTGSATNGRAAIFTTNVRVDIPIAARFVPYAIAGGGVAHVKETFATSPLVSATSALPVVLPTQHRTQSSTALALTAGGGVSLMVSARGSIDFDVRYLRLIANRDSNGGRFGIGFSHRF